MISGKLPLTAMTRADDGKEIQCRVTNAAMTSAKSVTSQIRVHCKKKKMLHLQHLNLFNRLNFDVLDAPDVSMRVNPSRPLQEGDSVVFSCDAVAKPDDVTWK